MGSTRPLAVIFVLASTVLAVSAAPSRGQPLISDPMPDLGEQVMVVFTRADRNTRAFVGVKNSSNVGREGPSGTTFELDSTNPRIGKDTI